MIKAGQLLTRHRNLFLLLLLAGTLLVSSSIGKETTPAAVNIPVTETVGQALSALESFRRQRDESTLNDMSALEALCSQELLDAQTRQDAADRLQAIVDTNQAQTAIEGALLDSSLSPCVAVISSTSLTIVTEKSSITEQDAALVMTLAQAHADIPPENVRIITAE